MATGWDARADGQQMKRTAMTALCAVAISVGFGTGDPTAAQAGVVDSYCHPTGDYCTGALKQKRRIKLKIATFSFRGSYGLCVRTPRRRTFCHHFHLEATSTRTSDACGAGGTPVQSVS